MECHTYFAFFMLLLKPECKVCFHSCNGICYLPLRAPENFCSLSDLSAPPTPNPSCSLWKRNFWKLGKEYYNGPVFLWDLPQIQLLWELDFLLKVLKAAGTDHFPAHVLTQWLKLSAFFVQGKWWVWLKKGGCISGMWIPGLLINIKSKFIKNILARSKLLFN